MRSIYLDYAASTPCDTRVLEAMRPFFFELSGNASSPHRQGRQARKVTEEARETVAAFIGALPVEIIFTSGASESNNQAIFSTAQALKEKGMHIIASAIEHHSVLEPLHQLEQDGFKITYVKPKSDGIVALEDIKTALQSDTILVCLQHANNEIGTLQPVVELGRLCRQRGIYFLVDATQTVGHLQVNVKDIQCDLLSLSAHKIYGPQGVGALYIRQGIKCSAFILGGDQERGRRAGTLNTTGIVGLGEAVKLAQAEMLEAAKRETNLRDRVIDFVLKETPGAILNGRSKERLPNNAHFSFEGISGEELVSALDLAGVAVSMGSACTWGQLEPSHVLKAIGLNDSMALGSLRVSVGRWTTEDDITYFLEQLKLKCKNALSKFLKESDGYISGEEMSQRLKMSRAAIWKHMQELRADGYEIAAVPHLGYQLVTCPDKLLGYEIQSGLNTKIIGKKIIVMDTVTSTMDEAFRLGMENSPEGTVVCAESQSKGRGRLGRVWSSPKNKGLYFSFVLRPSLPLNQLAQLTLMSAVALAEAIEGISDLKPSIKWPNDILLGNSKLAGILTELRAESDQVKFVIVGIGLNVNASAHQLPSGSTSLKIAGGHSFDRVHIFQAILRSLEKWYLKLLRHEFTQVMQEWKKRSATLKKRIRITDPAGIIEGEAVDLDEDGALLIRKDNGIIVKKTAGDVFLLR